MLTNVTSWMLMRLTATLGRSSGRVIGQTLGMVRSRPSWHRLHWVLRRLYRVLKLMVVLVRSIAVSRTGGALAIMASTGPRRINRESLSTGFVGIASPRSP